MCVCVHELFCTSCTNQHQRARQNSTGSECQVALEVSWKADLAGSNGGRVCCGEAVERQSRSLLVIMASRNNPCAVAMLGRCCTVQNQRREEKEETERKKEDKLGSQFAPSLSGKKKRKEQMKKKTTS